jgi:hypothetical protein
MYKILLGLPAGPGPAWGVGQLAGIAQASHGLHDVTVAPHTGTWDNFNSLWAEALNRYEAGEITHFAMLHADVAPQPGWIDVLAEELERVDGDLISVAIPIKDSRGLLSCGIGNPDNHWSPWFRLTLKEMHRYLPATFDRHACGYADPDWPLVFNNGCWLADLRRSQFRAVNADGGLAAMFDFRRRIHRGADGKWAVAGESEDWFFSRQCARLGLRTFCTRKVVVTHEGGAIGFSNATPWGEWDHDKEAPGRLRISEAE